MLNLLLQNELKSKKIESDSCDEFTKSILLLEMELLKIDLPSVRIENNISWGGIEVENMMREFNSFMCREIKNMMRKSE